MSDTLQAFKDWYFECLAKDRLAKVTFDDTICVHCKKKRKEHDSGMRCSAYVCTTHYRAINQEEVEKNTKILELMEQLAALKGWKLC